MESTKPTLLRDASNETLDKIIKSADETYDILVGTPGDAKKYHSIAADMAWCLNVVEYNPQIIDDRVIINAYNHLDDMGM